MKILRVKSSQSKVNPAQTPSGKCRRCHGYLAQEWESGLEVTVQRCVLCGHREELEAGKKTDTVLSF